MSISEHDLLLYAGSVFSQANTEVEYRACVGRAYYAAMLKCREYHEGLKLEETSRKHAVLIKQLLNPKVKSKGIASKSRELGLNLRGMKADREIADYDIESKVSRADAQNTLELAQITFGKIS